MRLYALDMRERTQGSKTFQYLEEKKTIKVISLVAASEKERAQTQPHLRLFEQFNGVEVWLGVVRQ
jgi:hypothetical protein